MSIVPKRMPPPAWSGPLRPVGTRRAAARSSRRTRARTAGAEGCRVRKTTVKTPSGRSPNSRARMTRARSESVPGTVNVFESSAGSRADATAPTTSTAIQAIRTGTRKRRTVRVQRSATR